MKSLLLIVSVMVAGFVHAQKPGSIPDSVKHYTILVMKAEQGIMQKRFNHVLENYFKKTYTGPFELVGKKDLEDAKYADMSKYRYTVNYYKTGEKTMRRQDFKGNWFDDKIAVMDVVFHDRLNNKDLNLPGIESGTYYQALEELGTMLEKSK